MSERWPTDNEHLAQTRPWKGERDGRRVPSGACKLTLPHFRGADIRCGRRARTGIARIEAGLKRAERILVESRRPGAGHAARSRARVADDFELLYRARFPRLIGRHSPRVESISDRR